MYLFTEFNNNSKSTNPIFFNHYTIISCLLAFIFFRQKQSAWLENSWILGFEVSALVVGSSERDIFSQLTTIFIDLICSIARQMSRKGLRSALLFICHFFCIHFHSNESLFWQQLYELELRPHYRSSHSVIKESPDFYVYANQRYVFRYISEHSYMTSDALWAF